MAGNIAGGIKTATKVKAKNPNFYREIGKLGGAKSRGGGFSGNPELARRAGAIGGRASRRTKNRPTIALPEPFFIADATIEQHIIEPFNRQPFYRGWFKRSK